MAITHSFVSNKVDDTDTTIVKPSDWNAQHTATYTALGGTARTLDSKLSDWISIKDFGAIGDNTSSVQDTAAFDAFTTAYSNWPNVFQPGVVGNTVHLLIPPGDYLYNADASVWGVPCVGIQRLTIYAYGASIFVNGNAGNGGIGGGYTPFGVDQVVNGTAHSALIAQANPFDSHVTLLSPADALKFQVGQWIMVAGLDTQGGGYPPNPYFHEFIQISAISGATISLVTRLQNGPYLTTWPSYDTGSSGLINQGGPATIYATDPTWDQVLEVHGLNYKNTGFVGAICRRAKFYSCIFQGISLPSASQEYILDNCWQSTTSTKGAQIEVDKCIDTLIFKNSEIPGGILLQSPAGVNRCVIDGCQNMESVEGGARNMVIRNSDAQTLRLGYKFGAQKNLVLENSRFISIANNLNFTGNAISDFSFSNGTFTISNNNAPVRWASPGTKAMFCLAPSSIFPSPFIITGVRQDSNNTYLDTTLGASLPAFSGAVQPTAINCAFVERVSGMACVGSKFSLSEQAQSAPPYTYARVLLHGSVDVFNQCPLTFYGNLVTITVNVLRVYTGTRPALALTFPTTEYCDASFAYQLWSPSIDVLTLGKRIITPGSVTGTGGADAIPVLATGTWFISGATTYLNHTIDTESEQVWPIIDVTITTDQGVFSIPFVQSGSLALPN